MKTVTTREAQHHLSKVLEIVEKGEDVIITRRGEKVAKLSSVRKSSGEAYEVDWSEAIEMLEEHLADMPEMEKNIVLEMREEERY